MSAFLLYCPSQILCQLSCTSLKKFHCNCLFQEACLVWTSCLQSGVQHSRLRPPSQCLRHVKHHSCASNVDGTNKGWFPYFLCPPCHLSKQKDSLFHCLMYLPSWVPRFMSRHSLHPASFAQLRNSLLVLRAQVTPQKFNEWNACKLGHRISGERKGS